MELDYASDGCGVPTYIARLEDIARAYADLAMGASPELALIQDAYKEHSFFMGGTDRVESYVNPTYGVVAKPGSDGLWAAAVPELGLGIAVKAQSGNENAASLAGMTLLEHLGIFNLQGEDEIHRLLDWDVLTFGGASAGKVVVEWSSDSLSELRR
jgi:L-asparaginase II